MKKIMMFFSILLWTKAALSSEVMATNIGAKSRPEAESLCQSRQMKLASLTEILGAFSSDKIKLNEMNHSVDEKTFLFWVRPETELDQEIADESPTNAIQLNFSHGFQIKIFDFSTIWMVLEQYTELEEMAMQRDYTTYVTILGIKSHYIETNIGGIKVFCAK